MLLTRLQFDIIDVIGAQRMSGRDVRASLAARGIKRTLAAFYQLMSRIEEGKLVRSELEQKVENGFTIKERIYRVTGKGVTAWNRTREHYLSAASASVFRAEVGSA